MPVQNASAGGIYRTARILNAIADRLLARPRFPPRAWPENLCCALLSARMLRRQGRSSGVQSPQTAIPAIGLQSRVSNSGRPFSTLNTRALALKARSAHFQELHGDGVGDEIASGKGRRARPKG